jgi:hypothetical protein
MLLISINQSINQPKPLDDEKEIKKTRYPTAGARYATIASAIAA